MSQKLQCQLPFLRNRKALSMHVLSVVFSTNSVPPSIERAERKRPMIADLTGRDELLSPNFR